MAKSEVEVNPGFSKVAAAVSDAIGSVTDTLQKKVTSLVTVADKVYGGNEIPTADLNAIADAVADERGWKGSSLKVRKSEVRALVAAYVGLEVAADKYIKATGSIGIDQLCRLARKLKEMTPHQAVQAVITAKGAGPKSKSPQVAIASTVKALGKVSARAGTKPRAFLDDFAKLCAKHGYAFGE